MGFVISAVFIPILGILAHARLQGTMLDFGKKISYPFSLIYCVLVYAISIAIPAPRTASVTYEMGIQPFFDINSLLFSTIYFALVLLFVLNRGRILNILGKYLTPLLLFILFTIAGVAFFGEFETLSAAPVTNAYKNGFLEGYQTFDAIGAIVVGAVVIISLKLNTNNDYQHIRKLIIWSGILAGLGLLLIYGSLIYIGSLYGGNPEITSRTQLLSLISYDTLGQGGRKGLAVLIGLACFTTAVGIITGVSDFVMGLFKNSKTAFKLTAILACLLGILIGQFNVDYIIKIAVPVLFLIYPVTIILILLNVFPNKFTCSFIFKAVVYSTILFSLPAFGESIGVSWLTHLKEQLPLHNYGIEWLIPAVITFLIAQVIQQFIKKPDELNPTE